MSDFYLGSFMGGAARGWDQGVKMAKDVRDRRMRKEVEEEAKKRAEVDEGYDDPVLWQSDITPGSEQARMLEQQTGGMGLSRAGGRDFASVDAARQYADKFNSVEGQYGRLADVYARHGEAEKAMGLRKQVQDMETQKRAAEEAAKRTALAEKQYGLAERQAAQQDTLFGQQQEELQRRRDYRDALGAYEAMAASDPEGARLGLRATHAALGDVGAAAKFDTDRAAADRQRMADDEATAIAAFGALRNGRVADANALFNQRGTAKLIVATGKTDKKTGQAIYQVFDPKTKRMETAGTPDQLIMQALPLPVAQKLIHDAQMMDIRQQELGLRRQEIGLRARGAGGSGDSTAMITRMQAQQTHFRTQLDAAEERLAGMDPKKNPTGYQEAVSARNAIAGRLNTVEQQLNQVFGLGGNFVPPPAPPPPPATGKTTPPPPRAQAVDVRTRKIAELEAQYGRGRVPRSEFFDWKGQPHSWVLPSDIQQQQGSSPLLRGLSR